MIVDIPDHMVYARIGVITFSKEVVTEYTIEDIDSIAKLQLTRVVNRTEKYKVFKQIYVYIIIKLNFDGNKFD